MNNITGTKMLHHLDRIFGDHKPITADIFLNNYCNNMCPYCTYRRWELDDGARYMSFADFVTYAGRLIDLGVKGFILTGGGEPTVSKDFDKIVTWLDSENIHYGINTNFNVYKEFNPDYLKVSLDAWDNESYEDTRGVPNTYDKVIDNIYRYADYKTDKTKLGIQLLAKSVDAVYKFYEANKHLPVDYISIRPMESTCGSYYKNLFEDQEELKPANIIKVIEQIASLDNRVVLNYKWRLLDTQQDKCTAQWAQIAINELGEVMYCCHKPYQIVGHIMDEDILAKKERAYTNMQMCDMPCRMTGPNLEVHNLLKEQTDIYFI